MKIFRELHLKLSKHFFSHCDEYNVLGFDCEWVSRWGGRQPVAILQLSTHRGLCVLVQLSQLRHIPAELKVSLTIHESVNNIKTISCFRRQYWKIPAS